MIGPMIVSISESIMVNTLFFIKEMKIHNIVNKGSISEDYNVITFVFKGEIFQQIRRASVSSFM